MVNGSTTRLEKLFKTATQLEKREDGISNSLQTTLLSQADGGSNGLSEEDIEKDAMC